MPKKTKLSLNERWSRNAMARRQRILDEGGIKFDVLIPAVNRLRLDAVLEAARKDEPKLSKTEWFTRLIDQEYGKLGKKRWRERGQGRDHSTEPTEQ